MVASSLLSLCRQTSVVLSLGMHAVHVAHQSHSRTAQLSQAHMRVQTPAGILDRLAFWAAGCSNDVCYCANVSLALTWLQRRACCGHPLWCSSMTAMHMLTDVNCPLMFCRPLPYLAGPAGPLTSGARRGMNCNAHCTIPASDNPRKFAIHDCSIVPWRPELKACLQIYGQI